VSKLSFLFLTSSRKKWIWFLSEIDRYRIILQLPEEWRGGGELVKAIVGRDVDLYEQLLNNPAHRDHHLALLKASPDEGWIALALLAIQYGYSAEDAAEAVFGSSRSWTGNESEMWRQWHVQFEQLREHGNPTVCQIGETGCCLTQSRMDRAKERERQEAVFGLRT
jgi:hypothetical protein